MTDDENEALALRKEAEDILRKTREAIGAMPVEAVSDVVHELQIHHIELLMQNEALRNAQEELETSNLKYYDLYDFAPIGYLTTDKHGYISEINLAAGKFLARSRSKLVGRRLTDFIKPEYQDTYFLHYQKAFNSSNECHCELVFQIGVNSLHAQLRSIADHRGNCRTAIIDISAQKKLEAELIRTTSEAQQANKAKTEFLANMSHEIRTPLNAIVGISEILDRSSPITDRQRKLVSTLKISTESLLQLINELLDISKIEASAIEFEQQPFNLKKIIDDAIEITNVKASLKKLNVHKQWEDAFPANYIGDGHRIKQVVLNLLSNAVKFTSAGGIRVVVKEKHLINNRAKVVIQVIDSGIGIPFEKQRKIFDTFTQADTSTARQFGGTGLGLTISEKLVKGMGGTITLESIEGTGSTFTVILILPLGNEIEEISNQQPLCSFSESGKTGEHKILLVEDYEPNVLVATTFLENLGYQCEWAGDGLEAIEKIKNNSYSLIFMDVQMPKMDGLEATKIIRNLEAEGLISYAPIIAMTAHAMHEDRVKCIQKGMDDYISKPFTQEELLKKIQKNLCILEHRRSANKSH